MHVENLADKKSMTELLKQINRFSKAEECKAEIQRSTVFLYASNARPQNDIKKTILFTIESIKYLDVNLTKEAQNDTTLLKEIKDLNKQKDAPCSWIRRPNIINMARYPKLMYIVHAVPIRRCGMAKGG